MPGGIPPQFQEMLADPEIQRELAKPGVAAKMQAAMADPSKMMTLLMDPDCGPLMQKLMGKMGGGGMGGMGGMGGFGGMPNMGGAGGAPRGGAKSPDPDDFLD
jgi:suppressor of tumorigenicity protein 13